MKEASLEEKSLIKKRSLIKKKKQQIHQIMGVSVFFWLKSLSRVTASFQNVTQGFSHILNINF